MTIVWVH